MAFLSFGQTTLEFNNIYYVDAERGLDGADVSGMSNAPFKTVNYAVTRCATSGDAIFAKRGVHDVTRIAGSYDSGGLHDGGKAITFGGVAGETTFLCDGSKHSGRDTHCIMFNNPNSRAYHIIFDFKVGGRSGNYQTSLTGGTENGAFGEIHNCVFHNDSPSPNFTYSNSKLSTISFYNCVFITNTNGTSSYSGNASTTYNCVSNFTITPATKVNTYENLAINPDYHLQNIPLEKEKAIGVHAGASYWTSGSLLFKSPLSAKYYSTESTTKWYDIKMYASNSPYPLVASASSFVNSSYEPYKAFDKDDNTFWYCNQKQGWLQIDLGKKTLVNMVRISKRTGSSYVGYAPSHFTIEGSNDATKWNKLGEYKGETVWGEEARKYQIRKGFYRYYRLNVLEPNSNSNIIYISSFELGYKKTTLLELDNASKETFSSFGKPIIQFGEVHNTTKSEVPITSEKKFVTNIGGKEGFSF